MRTARPLPEPTSRKKSRRRPRIANASRLAVAPALGRIPQISPHLGKFQTRMGNLFAASCGCREILNGSHSLDRVTDRAVAHLREYPLRCLRLLALSVIKQVTSQCTQIIGHIAEPPDHRGIAEIARGGIASTGKRNRAYMTNFARQRFGVYRNRDGMKHSVGLSAAICEASDSGRRLRG